VEKILNKRKMRGVNRYLVYWKGFTAENDTWEREKDLKYAREFVDEFKRRLCIEVRRQGIESKRGISPKVEECRRIELLGKYMAKLLYGWNNRKFEAEYLRKLERSWQK